MMNAAASSFVPKSAAPATTGPAPETKAETKDARVDQKSDGRSQKHGKTGGGRGGKGQQKPGGKGKGRGKGNGGGGGGKSGSRAKGGGGGGGRRGAKQEDEQFWESVQSTVSSKTGSKKKPQKTSPELSGFALSALEAAVNSPGNSPGGGNSKRRGQSSANHLLNFRLDSRSRELESRESERPRLAPVRSRGLKQSRQRKLGFLHANADIRFAVEPGAYSAHGADADLALDWECVQVVFFQQHGAYSCPICFESPTCPKMTKCGHVYCFVCALQYLSYSAEAGRKCPMCFEFIAAPELKSVRSKHNGGALVCSASYCPIAHAEPPDGFAGGRQ